MRESVGWTRDGSVALSVSWAVEDLPGLVTSLGDLRDALVSWARRRGGRAGRIALRIVAPHHFHDDAANLLLRLYRGEERLAPLLQGAHTTLALLEPRGDTVHVLDLASYTPSRVARRARPGSVNTG